MRRLDSVMEATNMNLTKLREAVEDRRACSGPWSHEESDTTKRLNDDDENLAAEGYCTFCIFKNMTGN